MDREAEFNRIASEEFAREYERETGHRLQAKVTNDRFPDAILEASNGLKLGAEFVSVVLPFVWQEEAYFNKYRERFYEALRPARPRYRHAAIRLQISSNAVEGPRPRKLPDIDGAEGKKMVVEFRDLLEQHFDALREAQGVLIERIGDDPKRAFPTLLEYFDAILVWDINEKNQRKAHPEDPLLESPVAIYLGDELTKAVSRALATKARKSPAYGTNLLVLHTLETPGKPHFPGAAMHPGEIETLGRELLTKEPELLIGFDEIWFLNAYWTEGRRLHRLK